MKKSDEKLLIYGIGAFALYSFVIKPAGGLVKAITDIPSSVGEAISGIATNPPALQTYLGTQPTPSPSATTNYYIQQAKAAGVPAYSPQTALSNITQTFTTATSPSGRTYSTSAKPSIAPTKTQVVNIPTLPGVSPSSIWGQQAATSAKIQSSSYPLGAAIIAQSKPATSNVSAARKYFGV